MSNTKQLAPIVALFADGSDFTLRVDDSELAKSIGPQLIALVGKGANKLTLITPTDIKVFKFAAEGVATQPPVRNIGTENDLPTPIRPRKPVVMADESAPPTPEEADDAQSEFNLKLAEMEKEEAEVRRMQRDQSRIAVVEEQSETPSPRRRAQRPTDEAPSGRPCGRCSGQGMIDGGGVCPVCQGRKTVSQWGARRGKRLV